MLRMSRRHVKPWKAIPTHIDSTSHATISLVVITIVTNFIGIAGTVDIGPHDAVSTLSGSTCAGAPISVVIVPIVTELRIGMTSSQICPYTVTTTRQGACIGAFIEIQTVPIIARLARLLNAISTAGSDNSVQNRGRIRRLLGIQLYFGVGFEPLCI